MQDLSKTNLEGRCVVISAKAFAKPLSVIERIFHCESGFGLDPANSGTKIYGHFVAGKRSVETEESYVRRYDIERLATAQEIQQAITVNQAREALDKKPSELVNSVYEGLPDMDEPTGLGIQAQKRVVAWVSQHDILPVQRKVLAEKLGDIEIVKIDDTYTDYRDLMDEIKAHGATYAVLVLPLSMIALILDSREGRSITWLRAEMVSAHEGECTETRYRKTASDQHNTVMQLEHQCSKFNPETDVLMPSENGTRHRRFLEFRILKGIKIRTEPFTGGE